MLNFGHLAMQVSYTLQCYPEIPVGGTIANIALVYIFNGNTIYENARFGK